MWKVIIVLYGIHPIDGGQPISVDATWALKTEHSNLRLCQGELTDAGSVSGLLYDVLAAIRNEGKWVERYEVKCDYRNAV